jgi:hypothetical protein
MGSGEGEGFDSGVDLCVPGAWGLAKAVEGLTEMANEMLGTRDNVALRLSDVNVFEKVTIEKSGFDI